MIGKDYSYRPPRFKRIGPGVYESVDGRVTMYRIEGCYPVAWNVEWTIDYQNWLAEHDPDYTYGSIAHTNIVDGAATKRDAMKFYAEVWPELSRKIARIEGGML